MSLADSVDDVTTGGGGGGGMSPLTVMEGGGGDDDADRDDGPLLAPSGGGDDGGGMSAYPPPTRDDAPGLTLLRCRWCRPLFGAADIVVGGGMSRVTSVGERDLDLERGGELVEKDIAGGGMSVAPLAAAATGDLRGCTSDWDSVLRTGGKLPPLPDDAAAAVGVGPYISMRELTLLCCCCCWGGIDTADTLATGFSPCFA